MTELQSLREDLQAGESFSLNSCSFETKSGTIEHRLVHTFDGAEFGTFKGVEEQNSKEYITTEGGK